MIFIRIEGKGPSKSREVTAADLRKVGKRLSTTGNSLPALRAADAELQLSASIKKGAVPAEVHNQKALAAGVARADISRGKLAIEKVRKILDS